jgi:NO-binding membrane sensor protein with MHYT domain
MAIFQAASGGLAPSYDPFFVLLSYLIAVGASYAALDMTERVTVARGRMRAIWLLAGAGAMGSSPCSPC